MNTNAAQRRFGVRFRHPRLAPLWIAVFIDILGFSVLIPYLPFFSEAFGAPAWQIGLLLSTNALFGFFSGPIWGTLSDRYGRKPTLLLSQLGTLVSFLMLAFSNSMAMMFASRILDGIFGGNYPIAKAVIGDVVPPQQRSEQMSNIGVAHVLSSLIGPALGSLLARWGILGPGLLSAGLTTVTLLVTWRYLEETHPLLASDVQDASLRRPPAQVKPRDVWRNPRARALLIPWGFHTLSFMIYISCVSLFANLRLGLDVAQVGRLLMLSGAVRVLIRFVVFVPLRRKLGDRRTVLLGLGTFVIVYFLLSGVRTPAQFGAVLCAVSFGAACSRGILNSFLSQAVEPWEQGTAMGLSASLDSFAQIAGPFVGGVVLDSMPLWVYGGITGVLALGAFVTAEHTLRSGLLTGNDVRC